MRLIPEAKLRALCESLGEYGFYLSVPATGEKLTMNAGARMISASTIKIPLLALLLRDGEQGRLELSRRITLDPANRVGGGGILQSLSPDTALTLLDFAVLMMVLSDNAATNQIIDVVGMDRADAFIAEMGWTMTHIGRKMETLGALLPNGEREQNYTCAADLADMMERIDAGTLVSPDASRLMAQIMAGQRNGKFRPALPCVKHYDPLEPLAPPPEGKVLLAAKSGSLPNLGVNADAGILILPDGRRAVLTMLARSADYQAASDVMGEIARTVYEALK